jgi:MacB-like periplasmic core domain
MPERGPARIPLACRVLIRAAGWLVPRGLRPEWLRKWRDGAGHWWAFLHEREEFLIRDGYAQLVRHCAGAFVDAFWQRFSREGLRRLVRSPAFVLLAAVVFWCITAIASGGFRTLRSSWAPLTYPNGDRLVVISQKGMFGNYGNPLPQIRNWSRSAKTVSGIAGYSIGQYPEGGRVTPDLFPLLGVKPVLGRSLNADDRGAALLSYSFWKKYHHKDPGILGRTVAVNWARRPMRVLGVLPDALPGLPDDVDYWTVLTPESKASRKLVETVARLKPGVRQDDAEKELVALARSEPIPLVRDVHVSSFRGPIQARTVGYFLGIGFGIVLGVALVAIGKQSPVVGRVSRKQALRCWAFLVVKFVLILGGLAVFWIEIILAIPDRAMPGEVGELITVAVGILPTLMFLVVCGLAVLWCIADQKRRCPVCLDRLAMPVTMGSWSSQLLDPVTTEFLCENGHGSLAMPESQSSSAEPDRWTAMDESWRDLFTSP